MKAETAQVQKHKDRRIEEKLDKIADLLETLVSLQEEESYPPESKIRRSFLKRAARLSAELRDGRLKMRTYKNFADFDRSIS